MEVKFTKEELWAVTFAVKADLEAVEGNMEDFGDDRDTLASALAKLERAERAVSGVSDAE